MNKKGSIIILMFVLIAVFAVGCKGKQNSQNQGNSEDISSGDAHIDDSASQSDDVESADVESADAVKFSDSVISMAVHDSLGKNYDESISKEELAAVEKLVIHRGYAMGVYEPTAGNSQPKNILVVDLSDVAMLTNLKELEIYNNKNDDIYCLSAIEGCKNLEKFSMTYYTYSDYMDDGRTASMGGNTLVDIANACPKLNYINTRVPLPVIYKEKISSINSSLVLEPEEAYVMTTASTKEADYTLIYEDGEAISNNLDDYLATNPKSISIHEPSAEEIAKIANTASIESVLIRGGSSYTFDVANIKSASNIKSLTLCGINGVISTEKITIINQSALADMENLHFLTLYYCSFSDAGFLNDMENLKRLCVGGNSCDVYGATDICSQLEMFYSYDEDAYVDVIDSLVDVRKLKITCCDTQLEIPEMDKLSSLYVEETFNSEKIIDVKYTENTPNLKKLCINGNYQGYEVDWQGLTDLPQLDVLYSNINGNQIDSIFNCENISRLYLPYIGQNLCQVSEGDNSKDIDVSGANKLSKLSVFEMGANDIVKASPETLKSIQGLKDINNRDVFVDLLENKYANDISGYEDIMDTYVIN